MESRSNQKLVANSNIASWSIPWFLVPPPNPQGLISSEGARLLTILSMSRWSKTLSTLVVLCLDGLVTQVIEPLDLVVKVISQSNERSWVPIPLEPPGYTFDTHVFKLAAPVPMSSSKGCNCR